MNGFVKIFVAAAISLVFWYLFNDSLFNYVNDRGLIEDSGNAKEYLENPAIQAYSKFLKKTETIQSLSEIEDYISPYYRDRYFEPYKNSNNPAEVLKDSHTLSKIKFTELHSDKPKDVKFSFLANSKIIPVNDASTKYKSKRQITCDIRMIKRAEYWYLQHEDCELLADDDYTGMTENEKNEKMDRDFRKYNLGID